MNIRKHINAKELPQFKNEIDYCYECDYGIQNYDEEGNKTSFDIHYDYINLNNFIDLEFIKFMEENKIDFVRID